MNKNGKDSRRKKIVASIVFVSFILSICYVIFRIGSAPSESTELNVRIKSDYVLILLQCIVGLIAMELPNIISRKMKLEIPSNMYLAFLIFLYCAIYLGEVRNFYYLYEHWDVILHAFSGGMLGALGFSVVSILNKEKKTYVDLSPLFVAVFAFAFAVTLGVVWEIYEYTLDGLLGMNMQKFALSNGTMLIGREAVTDTMKDLIVDSIGAATMCIIGYISLKYKTGWISNLLLKFKDEDKLKKLDRGK